MTRPWLLIIGFILITALGIRVVYAVQNQVTDSFDNETKIASMTNMAVSGGQMKLTTFTCGESTVTFNYHGSPVTYGTVLNPGTGECWLDRNLGASRVATVRNDSQAYGDLFQWGRLDDGHQARNSSVTTVLSTTDNPGHSSFIQYDNNVANPGWDWRNPPNDNLWQGVDGINNPCPSGWRIPTNTEWENERLSWAAYGYGYNFNSAFMSPLKLTIAGMRLARNILSGEGYEGYYWSSTKSTDNKVFMLSFYNSDAQVAAGYQPASAISIRCIKD